VAALVAGLGGPLVAIRSPAVAAAATAIAAATTSVRLYRRRADAAAITPATNLRPLLGDEKPRRARAGRNGDLAPGGRRDEERPADVDDMKLA
jgi:hypothetical protein